MKYFCAWLATCVGVLVTTKFRDILRQSPFPYLSKPRRNNLIVERIQKLEFALKEKYYNIRSEKCVHKSAIDVTLVSSTLIYPSLVFTIINHCLIKVPSFFDKYNQDNHLKTIVPQFVRHNTIMKVHTDHTYTESGFIEDELQYANTDKKVAVGYIRLKYGQNYYNTLQK